MALTIYDIAKQAGVSITTVSRVLNGRGEISEKTRARIQGILERSDYAPSQIARGLASKATKTIGVIALDLRAEHHATLVHQVEYCCSQSGYSCIVCSLANKPDRLSIYLEMLLRRQVDGMIFTGSVFAGAPYRNTLLSALTETPCVLMNASLPGERFYGVINDERGAFRQAVRYLHQQKGRRRIALIGGVDTLSERQKTLGYEEGLADCGLSPLCIPSEHTIEGGCQAAESVLTQAPDTDALLCTVDSIAAGCIQTMHHHGIAVPGDISVMGANNTLVSRACWPPLTVIDVLPYETGKKAVELLLRAIEGDAPEKEVILSCQLVEREST